VKGGRKGAGNFLEQKLLYFEKKEGVNFVSFDGSFQEIPFSAGMLLEDLPKFASITVAYKVLKQRL